MRPEQFIREPLRWIECFGRLGATLTAAPTFGYAYAAKRLRPEQLDGMSFERWRACIVGAERVDPVALAAFTALLEPHGFRAAALLPAYGLAEATLSVSGLSLDEVPQAIKPDWDTMTFGMPVRVAASARVGDPTIDDGAGWLVSCGTPHMGTSIEIIGEDRRALPPGCLGEIVVRGPSVARGYIRAGSGETTFSRSGVRTGDAGLIMDGSLYVVGRMGDRIKVRGRHRYAEEIESVLTAIPGVPTGRCVVVPGVDRTDRLSLVAIVEASPGDWIARVEAALHREVGGDSLIEVRCVEPGSIPRTSSGKPRRRMLWRQLLDEAATTRPGGNA
jgi:acyl-CoA synthetase (AMP-forming)/AMP-acid ligase II